MASKDTNNRKPIPTRRKKRYRLKPAPWIVLGLLLLFVLILMIWNGNSSRADQPRRAAASQAAAVSGGTAPASAAMLDQLYSPAAILVDRSTGKALAEQNGGERVYPASLTKIMTALVALEELLDLDELLPVPEGFFPELYAANASMAGFLPGETVRVRDLLYGVLLPSGAECCLALADRIAGSEDAFVELMNQKAEILGLTDTHFCNATGLHDDGHYSTVKDISALLEYALHNRAFRAIFTANEYSVPPTDLHRDGFTFQSRMFQALGNTEIPGGALLGGKTGYTEEAGLCLASLAQVDGSEYILVTAGAAGNQQTEQFHILDAVAVYSGLEAVRR